VAPVREPNLVGLVLQTLDDRMTRIDLQHRPGRGNGLARGFQHPLQMRAHPVFVTDQARRRVGEPMSDADRAGPLLEHALNPLEQRLVLVGQLFMLALGGIVLECA